jgi:hypothetical protein
MLIWAFWDSSGLLLVFRGKDGYNRWVPMSLQLVREEEIGEVGDAA